MVDHGDPERQWAMPSDELRFKARECWRAVRRNGLEGAVRSKEGP